MDTILSFFNWMFDDIPYGCNLVITHPSSYTDPKTGENINYHVQRAAVTAEEAAKIAGQFKAQSKDVFYGIGIYKDNITITPQGKTKVTRKKSNVAFLPALIADIDCGEGKPYLDYTEGARSTHNAMMELGFTPDQYSMICSGGGVHLYVKLDDILEPTTWTILAGRFKTALLSKGLQIDVSKTTDVALLLRPAGTLNFKKDTPRGVDFIHRGNQRVSYEQLELQLQDYSANGDLKSSYNVELWGGALDNIPDNLPPTALDIFDQPSAYTPRWEEIKCPQLLALEQDSNVPEPLWYQALGVAAYTLDPAKSAVVWSKNYDKYNEPVTLRKMRQYQVSATGPALCGSFEKLSPELCRNCVYKGQISTPLQAIIAPVDKKVVIQDSLTKTEHTYTLPKQYRVTSSDEIVRIVDGMEYPVSNYPIFVTSVARMDDLRNPQTVVTLAVKLPNGVKMLEISAAALLSSKEGISFSSKLIQLGAAMSPKMMKSTGEYLIEAYADFQRNQKEVKMTNSFGWVDNNTGFIWGNKLIQSDSITSVVTASQTAKKLAKEYLSSGSLDNWRAAVGKLAQPGREHLAFAVLIGLASPLYNFTNLQGISVNFYSEYSGTGKSTACNLAQSIFGNPAGLVMEKTSTPASIAARLGTVKNFPVLMDEISDAEGARASDLLYSISTGKERDRSDIHGDLRETRSWSLILMTTSNKSLYDKLEEHTMSSAGQRARLIEIPVNLDHAISEQDGEFISNTIADNYGVAAIPYLSCLVKSQVNGELQQVIDKGMDDFEAKFNFKFVGNERFIKSAVALAWVGGLIARKLHLLPGFDIDRIINSVIEIVKHSRERIQMAVPQIDNIVGNFLAENSRFIIQRHSFNSDINDISTWVPDEWKGRMDVHFVSPTQDRRNVVPDSAVVTIPVKALKDYCRINRIPFTIVEEHLSTRMKNFSKTSQPITQNLRVTETASGAPLNHVTLECYKFALDLMQLDTMRAKTPAAFVVEQPIHTDGQPPKTLK